LISLLMYIMRFYSLHESLHQEIAKYLSRFFWAEENNKQKYHMVKWSEICKPKDHGGLGVISSKRMNITLLAKWLWRIDRCRWAEVRYYPRKVSARTTPCLCPLGWGSQFWQSIIQLLPVLRIGTSIAVGSGSNTLFWLDRWSGTRPFAERLYALFSICSHP
uniref:Reverse transcriptase zinc-binding domain-containing protein n=1 Tax=Aegilops tauschii subsp. strangulata TaxID=200361 RepID=A0A452ZG47_AEGTS